MNTRTRTILAAGIALCAAVLLLSLASAAKAQTRPTLTAKVGWVTISPTTPDAEDCLRAVSRQDHNGNICGTLKMPALADLDIGAWQDFSRRGRARMSNNYDDYPGANWTNANDDVIPPNTNDKIGAPALWIADTSECIPSSWTFPGSDLSYNYIRGPLGTDYTTDMGPYELNGVAGRLYLGFIATYRTFVIPGSGSAYLEYHHFRGSSVTLRCSTAPVLDAKVGWVAVNPADACSTRHAENSPCLRFTTPTAANLRTGAWVQTNHFGQGIADSSAANYPGDPWTSNLNVTYERPTKVGVPAIWVSDASGCAPNWFYYQRGVDRYGWVLLNTTVSPTSQSYLAVMQKIGSLEMDGVAGNIWAGFDNAGDTDSIDTMNLWPLSETGILGSPFVMHCR